MNSFIKFLDTLVAPSVPSQFKADYDFLITQVRQDIIAPSSVFDTVKCKHYRYWDAVSKARRRLILTGTLLATDVPSVYKTFHTEGVDKMVGHVIDELRSFMHTLPRESCGTEPWDVV